MPGEHIDKIVNETLAKLNHVPLTSQQLTTATESQKAHDSAMRDANTGTEIFKAIESSSLTPTEKQEAYQRIAKESMAHQVKITTDPTTLLRANSATSRFLTEYMNTYAKGYMESVYDDTLKQAVKAQAKLPDSLKGKKVDSPYGHIDGVNQQDTAKLYEAYRDVSKEAIQSTERNLSKLSPEARAFMQAALEPTGTNEKALNMATASTLLLRGASPMMSSAGALLRDNPETQDVGNLLLGSNIALQTYANSMNRPVDKPLDLAKPQNVVANELRTDETMGQTTSAYKALAGGSEKVDEFVQGLDVEVQDLDVDLTQKVEGLKSTAVKLESDRAQKEQERNQKALQKELDKKLEPFNTQIKALEDKKAQLQTNPGIGDKIKCFFKHGLKGVNGEIEKLDKKIEATKVAKNDVEAGVSMEQRQQDLDRMKHNQAALGQVLQHAEGVVVKARLDESGLTTSKSVSDKQLKEAVSEGTNVKELQKELGERIKAQEKVLSVREKLGPKPQVQSQGQGKGVGI